MKKLLVCAALLGSLALPLQASAQARGAVATPHARQLAAGTAWASPGTVEVQNDIRVV